MVIAIIGILSAVGIGGYTQATIKSRDTQRKSDLNQIGKALELFNNDVGRYPNVDASGEMLCLGVGAVDVLCNGSIYAYSGTIRSLYMDELPEDPSSSQEYVYVPGDGGNSYAIFASLENEQDKDVVVDGEGNVTDWEIACGTAVCNYKLTETGLVRINPSLSESSKITPTPTSGSVVQ